MLVFFGTAIARTRGSAAAATCSVAARGFAHPARPLGPVRGERERLKSERSEHLALQNLTERLKVNIARFQNAADIGPRQIILENV